MVLSSLGLRPLVKYFENHFLKALELDLHSIFESSWFESTVRNHLFTNSLQLTKSLVS